MKRMLNPDLVWQKVPHDPHFYYEEQWVFLRDSRDVAPVKAGSVGYTDVEVIAEDPIAVEKLLVQLRDTDTALSALSGNPRSVDPQVILTHDCFGIQEAVRLLIFSKQPFAATHDS
jgi:hypothetical protein